MQDTELVVTATLCLASGGFHISKWGFSYFDEKFMSRLRGNKRFGVWPQYDSLLKLFNFKEDLLCAGN